MSNLFFRIRDGQLLLPEGATNLHEAYTNSWRALWQHKDGHLIMIQDNRVEYHQLSEALRIAFRAPVNVRFVLAVNEDNGGHEVVVALDCHDAWKIVSADHWIKHADAIIRLFPTRETADEATREGVIFFPYDFPEGWTGVDVWYLGSSPDIATIYKWLDLSIENGWRIAKLSKPLICSQIVPNDPVAFRFSLLELFIDEAGVSVIFRGHGNFRSQIFCTRRFTHAEARELLRLY